jgi:hypothetical protein
MLLAETIDVALGFIQVSDYFSIQPRVTNVFDVIRESRGYMTSLYDGKYFPKASVDVKTFFFVR